MRRKRLEQQLDKELRFHLDRLIAGLIARGHTPAEARRQAKLAFGSPEQVKEDCRDARGVRWLEDLLQDIRYAVRTLRQKPGFAAVALCALALGCGSATVIFTVINSVLLKPLSYPDPEKLVTVLEHTGKYGDQWGFAYPNFLDAERASRTLGMAAWSYAGGTAGGPGDAEYVSSRRISSGLFPLLGVSLLRGRSFRPEEDRPSAAPVIIISDSLWQRRFGRDPAAIGASLTFEGKPYLVVGVAPTDLQLFGETSVFTPLGQSADSRMQNREARFLHVLARLRPAVTLAEAQAELALISRNLSAQYPKSNSGRSFVAQPLRQDLVASVRSTLWLLLAAVMLVLLIACVNVASLSLARAVSRERELAMRVALGASRGRLARQCLTESAVLSVCGGALGVLLAAIGIRPFLLLWPGNLPRAAEVHLDWRVLVFTLAVSLVSGLLFGLAPAFRAPAQDPEKALRAGARTLVGSSRRLQGSFVISEIALAMTLLAAAGTLGRALLRLSDLDPGFNLRNALVARVAISPAALSSPAGIRASWRDLADRARRVPGIESAALSDIIPMRAGENSVGYWTTPAPPPLSEMPLALASSVTPDYLKVMGIPLRQGRFFTDQDRIGAEPVVVIDENLARRAFPWRNATGRALWVQSMGRVKVVGVAGHVRHWGLAGDDRAQVRDQLYYPFAQVPDSLMTLFSSFMSLAVRTTVEPLGIVEPLRRELRGTGADPILYEVRTMEQLASASLARQRFLLLLFGVFAALALLLASIGVYGVLSYLTNQRTEEIGVRMALGAGSHDVIKLVLRQSLKMILSGLGAGALAALAAGRALEHAVAGVRSIEPLAFLLMISLLATTALFASYLPARRASRIDPMKALRIL